MRPFLRIFIPLGIVEAEVVGFYDTRCYSQEFVCTLRKSKSGDVSFVNDLLQRLPSDQIPSRVSSMALENGNAESPRSRKQI
jgi:hypothetical protein